MATGSRKAVLPNGSEIDIPVFPSNTWQFESLSYDVRNNSGTQENRETKEEIKDDDLVITRSEAYRHWNGNYLLLVLYHGSEPLPIRYTWTVFTVTGTKSYTALVLEDGHAIAEEISGDTIFYRTDKHGRIIGIRYELHDTEGKLLGVRSFDF